MIVSCPSCGTLYRTAVFPETVRARCSCCDGTVAVAPRRSYALVGAPRAETLASPADLARATLPFVAERPAGSPVTGRDVAMIGMDDPSLATRLTRTALDVASRDGASTRAMTWTLLADDAAPRGRRAQPAETAVPALDRPVLAGQGPEAPQGDTMFAHDGEGAIRPVLVGVALGALAGIAGSAWLGGSAVSWWAGGALAGGALVLGMRGSWTSRRD